MLDTLPPDILEHVAYFASTHTTLGPPSGLPPLLALCRYANASLCRSANPHLYARIFTTKFDLAAPQRRLAQLYGPDMHSVLSVNALADELVRRFTVLMRLRAEFDARSPSPESSAGSATDDLNQDSEADARLIEILWTAYLMVLEDEGRNAAQLRNARVGSWLAVYWFDSQGASGSVRALNDNQWPLIPEHTEFTKVKEQHALAMWLLWFFLDPPKYVANPDLYRRAEKILKLVSLNAPLYPLTQLPWTSFHPEPTQIHLGAPGEPTTAPFDPRKVSNLSSQSPVREPFTHFTHALPTLTPLPPSAPACLSLLALHARSRRNADTLEGGLGLLELLGPSLSESFIALPNGKQDDTKTREGSPKLGQHKEIAPGLEGEPDKNEQEMPVDNYRWESEWLRSLYAVNKDGESFNTHGLDNNVDSQISGNVWKDSNRTYKTFQPGSFEGIWEGTFTYTEFHSFAALLAGALPSKLQDCLIAQHSQTWSIREYHLLAPPKSTTSSRSRNYASRSNQLSSTSEGEQNEPIPLPIGDPINAHVPVNIAIESDSSLLRVTLPSSFSPPPSYASSHANAFPRVYNYTRYRGVGLRVSEEASQGRGEDGGESEENYASRVRDILLMGEGHSGWGEFRIIGRIRPVDGFISLLKDYTGGDRGCWLYRGNIIGGGSSIFEEKSRSGRGGEGEREGEGFSASGIKGFMAGRWRDTHTPAETHGYEGAFAMARRRSAY